jgi:hypothetical protein
VDPLYPGTTRGLRRLRVLAIVGTKAQVVNEATQMRTNIALKRFDGRARNLRYVAEVS